MAGLGLAAPFLRAENAFADAQLIKISDAEWNNIDGATLYINLVGIMPTITVNKSPFSVWEPPEFPGERYCGIRAGTTITQGSTYTNFATFVYKNAVLDSKTGEQYDLIVDFDVTFYGSSGNNTSRGDHALVYGPGSGENYFAFNCEGYTWSNGKNYQKMVAHVRVEKNGAPKAGSLQCMAKDLDMRQGSGMGRSVAEQLKFTPVPTKAYVSDNTYLGISDGNSRFWPSTGGNTPDDDKRAWVAVIIPTSSFDIEWWGEDCSTKVFTQYAGYPNVTPDPVKTAVTDKVLV